MNKEGLIAAVAVNTGLTKKDVEDVVDEFLGAVKESVSIGDRVNIPGFGIFELRHRAARKGRNMATGEEMQIPASNAPSFKPAKAFKDACKG